MAHLIVLGVVHRAAAAAATTRHAATAKGILKTGGKATEEHLWCTTDRTRATHVDERVDGNDSRAQNTPPHAHTAVDCVRANLCARLLLFFWTADAAACRGRPLEHVASRTVSS